MSIFASILIGAGFGMQAIGAIQQGSATKAQSEVQAEIYNRQMKREAQIKAENTRRLEKSNSAAAATQRAVMAANGGDLSTGSNLLIQGDLAEEGAHNVEIAKNNADVDIAALEAQSSMGLQAGRAAQTASFWRAGSSLLRGAGEFA